MWTSSVACISDARYYKRTSLDDLTIHSISKQNKNNHLQPKTMNNNRDNPINNSAKIIFCNGEPRRSSEGICESFQVRDWCSTYRSVSTFGPNKSGKGFGEFFRGLLRRMLQISINFGKSALSAMTHAEEQVASFKDTQVGSEPGDEGSNSLSTLSDRGRAAGEWTEAKARSIIPQVAI